MLKKVSIAALILLLAAGFGYRAFDQQQRRQLSVDTEQANADPDTYMAKQWAARAKLRCDEVSEVAVRSTDAGAVPSRFDCAAPSGNWIVSERSCAPDELKLKSGDAGLANGYPATGEQLFKPRPDVCWQVQGR